MTWLFVSTMPDLLMIMPVAAAAAPAPSYFRLLVMTTRPGWTADLILFSCPAVMLEPGLAEPPLPNPVPPPLLPNPLLGWVRPPLFSPDPALGWLLFPATNATTSAPAVAAIAATWGRAGVPPRGRGAGGWP